MKKMILGVSLVSALVLMTACGDSGDSKVAFDDVKIEYKNEGTYDLSQYLVPAQNQISNYVENVYTNQSGKRDYSNTPDEGSPSYSKSQFNINGTTIEVTTDGTLDTTFNILADKINSTDADDNSVESYVRYTDKGNYILKKQGPDGDSGNLKLVCKLANHHNSKKVSGTTYNDIIELSCTIDAYDSGTVGGSKVEVIGSGTSVLYFAKNKGSISTVTDICVESKTDGTKTKAICSKTTEEITTIN